MCSLCSGSEVVKYVPQKENQRRLYAGSSLLIWKDLENRGEMEKRRRKNTGDQPPLAWLHHLCKPHGDSWRMRNHLHVGIFRSDQIRSVRITNSNKFFIKIWNRMMVIPLTRDTYHCLDSSLVFDPKFKSFKGNLKYWSWVFLVQFSTHSEILYDVIFSALEA